MTADASKVADYTTWAGQEIEGSDAEVFIQWKGTDACLDFYCPCGAHVHLDDSSAYSVRCEECNATYDLGTQVRVRRTDEPFSEPKEMRA
jgi:hypothetical protein